jgi:hypothetical protein
VLDGGALPKGIRSSPVTAAALYARLREHTSPDGRIGVFLWGGVDLRDDPDLDAAVVDLDTMTEDFTAGDE